MELGKKLLNLRKKKGLSQEELSERIGVTRQTISNWELGETSPNPDQLKLLSKELNVSIDELLDNDVKDILVEKVSNTEELSKLVLKVIKTCVIFIISVFVLLIVASITLKVIRSHKDTGREIEESIHCELYGEEHGFSIAYQEYTGVPIAFGGDTYFFDILDLDKYNDAHQIFNITNDYVKKNGGTCSIIEDYDLNDIVNFYVKDGTVTKKNATFILETKSDYKIGYGEAFTIEKYDSNTHDFQVFNSTTDKNCAFNMIGYSLDKNKKRELKQDWSCFYDELPKGLYRIVKHVNFDSDIPISEDDVYYIWAEFEIE